MYRHVIMTLFLSIISFSSFADTPETFPPTPTYKEQIPLFFDRLGANKSIQISGFREDNYDDITFDKVPVKSNKLVPFTEVLNTDISELRTFKYFINSNRIISNTLYYGYGKVYKVSYSFSNNTIPNDSDAYSINYNDKVLNQIKSDLYTYLENTGYTENDFFLLKWGRNINKKMNEWLYDIKQDNLENADSNLEVPDKTFKRGDYVVTVHSGINKAFTVQLTLASTKDEFENIESIDAKNRENKSKEIAEQRSKETIQNIIRTDK